MDMEDEDDIYAPEDGTAQSLNVRSGGSHATNTEVKEAAGKDEDEEEGEEVEEDESDSDIDIITERKGDAKADSLQQPRASATKTAPLRVLATDQPPNRKGSPAIKAETSGKDTPPRPGSSYPALKTSNIDVDAKPFYEPNGKPITEIDMDADFPDDDKPWRRPGTDMTDFFNYGFDEFTWASYCLKQTNMRKEITDSKKQMEEMQNFLTMPSGMPGMPGPPGGAPSGVPAMGGPGDIPPEMQQMMQHMMAQGIDPTQMDQAAFMQMMQGSIGGAAGDSNQSFVGQGYGQQNQNQQQMGYGFGSGGGGRNQGGRGQGRRW